MRMDIVPPFGNFALQVGDAVHNRHCDKLPEAETWPQHVMCAGEPPRSRLPGAGERKHAY